MKGLSVLLTLGGALPALALTPPMPCTAVTEGDMTVTNVQIFGGLGGSGVTVEDYYNARTITGTDSKQRPGPVPELDDFGGARVVICATGEFVAIPRTNSRSVNDSLSSTEFLRADVKADRRVRFSAIRRAARAVYGDVIVLRETEETCGCSVYFPDLKPAGMTGFSDRTNVEQ